MVIKVGINGFGRVGRIVSRACLQNSGLELTAINDPAISVDYVSYLMKFDSTHGRLNGVVTHNDDEIIIDGHHVKVFHEKYPPNVPWQAAGVEYVVEASGMFTSYEKASGHLLSLGVKRVIVTAPSVDVPMVILGVNDKNIPPDRRVISCASSTLYCLAPIAKVLEDSFGVEDGFVTSIHAMTPSLKPLDGLCLRGRHWRDHRSIHQNIIPAPTGACKALGKILPTLKDKLSGLAFRVPIVNVSVLDFTVRLQTDTNLPEIMKAVQRASKSTLRKIIRVSNDEAVSSDFMTDSHSCILDEDSSIQLKPNFFKIICWYENEHSYACRVVDSIIFSENQFYLEIPRNINNLRPVMSTKILQTDRPIICNCKPGGSTELTPNLSQSTGVETRSSTQSLLDRKGISQKSTINPAKYTKTDELIKIWNNRSDVVTPCLKPVRCYKVQKVESNTNQERLDNVKREFTKMISITEDLLRKTQSTQGVRSAPKAELRGETGIKFRENEDAFKPDAKSYTQMNNVKISSVEELDCKCSGDMISQNKKCIKDDVKSLASIQDKIPEFKSGYFGNVTGDSKNFINISEAIKELIDDGNDNESLIQLESKTNNENFLKIGNSKCKQTTKVEFSQVEPCKCVWNSHYFSANNVTNTDHLGINNETNSKHLSIDKEINSGHLSIGKEMNSHHSAKDETNYKHISTADETNSDYITMKNEMKNYHVSTNNENEKIAADVTRGNTNIDLGSTQDEHLSLKNDDFQETNNFEKEEDNISSIISQCKLKREKSNIELIDDELKKRNIVLVENTMAINDSEPSIEEDDASIAEAEEKLEQDVVCLSEPTVDFTDPIVSQETSTSATPANTASGNCEHRQDIYDKLDSTSGSESNNSFEVKERKSQVIQLTDLTNSVEDLTRLNNICRIIEISDELSDKLFSALDDTEPDLKKKTWSFKDLCNKLKLDEFCNKVFGGTTV